ncbi:hypothetical protein F5876DRAFT_84229 [Lentinula aff. lateritia]|uniref:Uncharacterized protein n=1 Tax=Lentinula aff. lateritia TaxID=2804960 RepID=A0ACC1TGT9_9AGAR|nr:hypothetical protein F5876DRAFT_84229 [Lentinula aff. lateritia]
MNHGTLANLPANTNLHLKQQISPYSLFLYLSFSTLVSRLLRSSKQSNTRFYSTSKQSDSPTSIVLLWDLDLGNVKATPYVELHVASPLIPPPLEDASCYPHFPGTQSQA